MSHGPFIHHSKSVQQLVRQTLVALIPIVLIACYRYGWDAIQLFFVSLGTVVITDWYCNRKKFEANALITGTLWALLLPIEFPLIWTAIGAFLAITLGKYLFGGLGENPFNPTAFTRVLFMIHLPALTMPTPFDGISQATPLSKEVGSRPYLLTELFYGYTGGTLAESSMLALLIGGALLIFWRTIDWRIPLFYLASISLSSLLLPPSSSIAGHTYWLAYHPLYHLLSGGTLLTAFFLLTDPVTSPLSSSGRIAYAILAGIYTMLIRLYTPYPDGAIFAVLLANAHTVLFDSFFLLKRVKKNSSFPDIN